MNETSEERDDDPLVELGSLWRNLAPPDPTASVDAPDAATLATVEWLRAAWCASTPASSALPWSIRIRAARRTFVSRGAPWAAAAALLIALALLLPPRRAPQISRGDLIVDLPVAAAPEHIVNSTGHAAANTAPLATPFCDSIPLVSVDAGRMEMRRGPVRLILVTESKHYTKNAEPRSAKEPKR